MSDVKVYMIANLQIHDADNYRNYEKGFFPILKKHGGEFITYDDNVINVEGDSKKLMYDESVKDSYLGGGGTTANV